MHRLFPALLVASLLMGAQSWADDISPAETLLFLDSHLGGVSPPAKLRYRFAEMIKGAPERKSELELSLQAKADGGCCAVTADEAGGPAFVVLPPIEEAKSNPVILYFLERDIRQMQTLTGGQPNYFRRLIRLALAQAAPPRETTVRYRGRDVSAREILVTPYRDDPRRAQYPPLAAKTYRFVLAGDVPGGVFLIGTLVPAEAGSGPPLAQALLTLEEPKP